MSKGSSPLVILTSDWSAASSKDIWSDTSTYFECNGIVVSSTFAESSFSIHVLKSPTLSRKMFLFTAFILFETKSQVAAKFKLTESSFNSLMFILSPKETFSLKKIILNNKQKTLYRNRQWNNLQITHINNYNEKHIPFLFCNKGTSMYCFDMISAFYSAEEVYYKDF